MDFHNANTVLHLLWLLPLLAAVSWYGRCRRRQRLAACVADAERAAALTDNVSLRRRGVRGVLFGVALVWVVIAMARPYWGARLRRRPVRARDLVIVLDASRSMLARDLPPTRLAHAKQFIRRLVADTPGDRFGLVVFAGDAFLECPLTRDADGFLLFLDDVDTASIPVGGTHIEAGLRQALTAFDAAEGSHRAVILVTDGDQLQGDAGAVLEHYRQAHLPIFAVGLGDPNVGTYIQIENNKFVADAAGNKVRTRLNEAVLRRLSRETQGIYVHSTIVHDGREHLLRRVRNLIPAGEREGTVARPIERYQAPLAVALLCLFLRLLLGERRYGRVASAMTPAVAVLSVWSLVGVPGAEADDVATGRGKEGRVDSPIEGASTTTAPALPREAIPSPLSAARTQRLRRVVAALEAALRTAEDPREQALLHYLLGVRQQTLGDGAAAERHYLRAVELGGDWGRLRAAACQNLGVLKHPSFAASPRGDPEQALADLAVAQQYYREAMRAWPQNTTVAINQELALRDQQLYEQLKESYERLRRQRQEARARTRAARDAQDATNAQPLGVRRDRRQRQARGKAQAAMAAVQAFADQARASGREPTAAVAARVAERLAQAQRQQAAASDTQRSAVARARAAAKAAAQLAEACRLLGGGEQSEDSGGQPTAQTGGAERGADGEPPAGAAPAEAPNAGGVAGAGGVGTGRSLNVDKQQALRILADMQGQERALKERLKALRRQSLKQASVDRDW